MRKPVSMMSSEHTEACVQALNKPALRRSFSGLFLAVLFGVLLSPLHGFLFFSRDPDPIAEKLGVIYHPYPVPSSSGWAPLPSHHGMWTRERMLRDIRRLETCGISVVLVSLPAPRILGKSEQIFNDMNLFMQLCQNRKILVYPLLDLSGQSLMRNDQEKCLRQLKQLQTSGKLPEASGRRVCFLSGSQSWRVRDPGYLFLPLPSTAKSPVQQNPFDIGGADWIFAKLPAPDPDPSYRSKDKISSLKDTLEQLADHPAAPVDVICLDSWNDYGNSRVIEPNTFDGQTIMNEISKWSKTFISNNLEE